MALLDLLHEGSFRGAKFYVRTATTTGGRKQAQHDYPNSNKQSVEDLGFKPRSFQLEALISDADQHDPRSYFQKRDDLLKALETAGNGTLSHPFFSSSFEVTARPYTLVETISTLGFSTITMQFDYNDIKTNPQPIINSLPNIAQKVTNFIASAKTTFINQFNALSPISFQKASDLMNDFTSFTQSVTNTFAQLQEQTSPFTLLVNTFREDITSLIPIPENLANGFFDIINSVSGLFDSPDTLLDVYSKYFDFGDDLLEYPNTTSKRINININNQTTRNAAQSSFLAFSYLSASQKEYTTVIDIDNVQEVLETQYQKLRGYGLPADNLKLLTELRTIAVDFLQAERLKAADIVTVAVPTSGLPLSVIGYQFYAENDNDEFYSKFQTLIDLNRPNSNNLSSMAGDLSVVTNAD